MTKMMSTNVLLLNNDSNYLGLIGTEDEAEDWDRRLAEILEPKGGGSQVKEWQCGVILLAR